MDSAFVRYRTRTLETPRRTLKPPSSGVVLWKPGIVLADRIAPVTRRPVVAVAEPSARPPAVRSQVGATRSLLGSLAQGLAGGGEIAQALATIDEALARSERDEEYWCIAELLRIKGELIVQTGARAATAAAEEHFQQALQWARRQGALSLELRSATGLARRWHERGRTRPARELLAPVYRRFTEGFDTADLRAARALLDHLG